EPTFEYRHQSDTYVWMDCRVLGRGDARPIARAHVSPPAGLLTAPGPMWNYAWSGPLGPSPAGREVTVEIECTVHQGSVGFVLWQENGDRFLSREIIMEARTGSQRLCLTTAAYASDTRLLTRRATALGASEYRIDEIEVREAL